MTNRKLLISSAVALALSFTASSASAADIGSGTITFDGVVNTGACTIAPSSVNKEVNLGSVRVSAMQSAGNQGPASDFTLELLDCVLDPEGSGTDYSKVGITFSGAMDMNSSSLWANNGSATNVGVFFQDSNGNTLVSGDTVEQALRTGTNTINLTARMQSTGAATAGTVRSTAAYVLNYQ